MKYCIIVSICVLFLFLAGCSQQTRYVCPDGSTASDVSNCPKQETAICTQIAPPTGKVTCKYSGNSISGSYECNIYITGDNRIKYDILGNFPSIDNVNAGDTVTIPTSTPPDHVDIYPHPPFGTSDVGCGEKETRIEKKDFEGDIPTE